MKHEVTSWAVVCDFDGTISLTDATDALLEAYGTDEWRAIEKLWERGEIGSRECLSRQVSCIRATMDQIHVLADSIQLDPHFVAFSHFCADHSIPLSVVSDGLEQVILRILARHGLGHLPVIANRLDTDPRGGYKLASPHGSDACLSGTCKCAVMRDLRATAVKPQRLLFFGDGRSDFCAAAKAADVVAAKAGLLRHMRALGRPVIEWTSFAEAPDILARLIGSQDPIFSVSEGPLHERA